MEVHFELAQESRRRLIEAEVGHIGCVLNKRKTQACECLADADGPSNTELGGSKYFMRLSQESFLDLDPPQLQALSEHCVEPARRSEEFFLIANAPDQWLRTVIEYEETNRLTTVIPDIIIHSNVLPYHPYWSNLQTTSHGNVHFPAHILQDALKDGKTLRTKLEETGIQELIETEIQEFCGPGRYRSCGNGNCERTVSKLFLEIKAADVQHVRLLYGTVLEGILLITWRGGQFVQKVFQADDGAQTCSKFDMELDAVKRLSHPNIVYSFGELDRRSYFMEYMSTDLLKVIVDRIDRVVGDDKPPFVAHEVVHLLSQVAKAMRHMHQENVVHCDLKSSNILLSEIVTPYNLNGKHYLAKVADFGSAQLLGPIFTAGDSTTEYSAPEVLQQRTDKARLIGFPHKIDVYSFGIVAFEVLTGILISVAFRTRSRSEFRKGVIEGTWRPPLRVECEKHKETFIQDEELISLIEGCWHRDPSQRPSFAEICDKLHNAKVRHRSKFCKATTLHIKSIQV